jgi:hypothetical protein
MWDVQEGDERCEVQTKQGSKPLREDYVVESFTWIVI